MSREGANIGWADGVKATCIVLVVYGHMYGLSDVIKHLIYSMHLPAFLFVTGYLIGERLNTESLFEFTRKRIIYNLNLYVFFTVVAVVLWYLIEARGHPLSEMMKPLLGGLGGVNGPAQRLVHNNGPIWYFPFLIVSLYVAYLWVRLPVALSWVVGALLLIVYSFWWPGAFFWSLDLAPIGGFFILMGLLYRRVESHEWFRGLVSGKFAFLAIATAWLLLAYMNGSVNLNGRMFGYSGTMFMFAGSFGVLAIVQGAKIWRPPGALVKFLANNTLFIFCSHFYLVKAVRVFHVGEFGWVGQLVIFAEACAITLICAYISTIVQPYLLKYLKPKSVS